MAEFVSLPYYDRPDLTPYLIHLLPRTDESAEVQRERLLVPLREGVIRPPGNDEPASRRDAHLLDIPFYSLKHVAGAQAREPRGYEPYGIVISKQYAYQQGARPAIYLSDEEVRDLSIPPDERWRVVPFGVEGTENWTGWLHEREWRMPGELSLPHPHTFTGVIVKTAVECRVFREQLDSLDPPARSQPRAIIPLQVVCQGLGYISQGLAQD